MILAFDAAYGEEASAAAGLLFEAWPAETADGIVTRRFEGPPAPYKPGAFYQRELPLLLDVLDHAGVRPDIILVDGYVWTGPDKPGLGARLYEALDRAIPVIGVAKTPFRGDDWSIPVLRGKSRTPLHVTAAGLDPEEAAEHIRRMHGPHRLPVLLKEVDRAARDALARA